MWSGVGSSLSVAREGNRKLADRRCRKGREDLGHEEPPHRCWGDAAVRVGEGSGDGDRGVRESGRSGGDDDGSDPCTDRRRNGFDVADANEPEDEQHQYERGNELGDGWTDAVAHRLGQRVCGFAKGEVRQSHPHDSANDLGGGIQAGGRDVEGPGRYEADGHCRIEVRTRHRTQEGDECRQPGTNGHTVCEELEYAVGAEALDHDPASDDQVQQHGRAETFRSDGPRAIDHQGASTSKRSTRSVMSANAVTNASAVPTDTGSGTDQCRWGSVNGMPFSAARSHTEMTMSWVPITSP